MGKKEKFVYVHGVGPKELDVLLDTESVSTGQPILRFAQLAVFRLVVYALHSRVHVRGKGD